LQRAISRIPERILKNQPKGKISLETPETTKGVYFVISIRGLPGLVLERMMMMIVLLLLMYVKKCIGTSHICNISVFLED
jgi:hypothetical protein